MSVTNVLHRATENKILAALPRAEYERILPHLEQMHLPQGKMISDAGDTIQYAYFPLDGMISLLSLTQDGESLEVAMVGNEGVAGAVLALKTDTAPYRMVVQLTANVMRISAGALKRELIRGSKLEELMLTYLHSVLVHVSQSAVCARFHTVEKRLCRWLLVTRDRVEADSFDLTQEIISHMLGTPRPVVTTAAGILQDLGIIRYRRGKITILDPKKLREVACECYAIVEKDINKSYVA